MRRKEYGAISFSPAFSVVVWVKAGDSEMIFRMIE